MSLSAPRPTVSPYYAKLALASANAGASNVELTDLVHSRPLQRTDTVKNGIDNDDAPWCNDRVIFAFVFFLLFIIVIAAIVLGALAGQRLLPGTGRSYR